MINFPDSPIIGQQFTVGGTTWTWDGTVWTATGNILGISDAPTDGQIYARSNASWVLSSGGGGGGISDAPSDGTLYARKNNTWAHVAHTDITDWTATLAPYALTSSLPVASTSTPLMDGIAAVGTGTTWARADHVHPHDTTLYSASNPAGYIPDAPNDTNTYARHGAAWVALPTLGVTISATPPVSPSAGQMWWDSVGGQLYVWYNDGTSSQWVVANNVASQPPPASTTTLGSVKVDGTSIQAAGDGTISTVLVPMGDNRIINGDMRIDQRNNGASQAAAYGYFVDRWYFSNTRGPSGNVGRNLNAIAGPPGFPYYLGFQSASTPLAPNATDNWWWVQYIEADLVSDFAWGTPNAQPVTLSFWAYSSLTGLFSSAFMLGKSGVRTLVYTFSLPTANTWTKISVTIPGDTAGAWVMSGNATALGVVFNMGMGTNFITPTLNTWLAGTFWGATGTAQVVATANATFYVTGVKLEIGNVATPFNRQSLTKSMADCQRYFFSGYIDCNAYMAGTNVFSTFTNFPAMMRTVPTIAYSGISYVNASGVTAGAAQTTGVKSYASATATGVAAVTGNITASAEL